MYLKNGNGALFGGVRVLHGGDDDPLRGAHLGPVLEPGDGGRWLAGLGGGLAAQRGGLVPGHQHVRGVLQQPRRGPGHPWVL